MKSLEELKEIKEQAKKNLVLRERNVEYKVTVSMGECGYNTGAREILTTFLEEVANRKLPNVLVAQSDCLGYCEYEPVVKVEGNGQTIIYGKVTVGVVNGIIESHLRNGNIVNELTIETLSK